MDVKQAASRARALAEERLRAKYGFALTFTDWQRDPTAHVWADSFFQWEPIVKYPHSPTQLEVAVWLDDRLAALGVATEIGDRLILRFVEGNPDLPDELKGQRLPMVLEVAAIYAETIGKAEIRFHPVSPRFLKHCVERLGLELVGDGDCRLKLGVIA